MEMELEMEMEWNWKGWDGMEWNWMGIGMELEGNGMGIMGLWDCGIVVMTMGR